MSEHLEPSIIGETDVPLTVLAATRALLRLTTAADARRAATDLVRGLGGSLVTAGTDSASIIPADLSFGHGEPLLAAAPPGSAARARLERHLVSYLSDANLALELSVRADRLAESASTDVLTGLPNRRMIDRALGRLTERDFVIIVDLDHFKRVNDDFGHAAGDEILRVFGGVLRDVARGRDLVGRFGGEEFVAVIESSDEGAEVFLQRLRVAWVSRRPRAVTFSAGIARSVRDPDVTIRLADEALYRAKGAGRDQWCHAVAAGPSAEIRPTDYVRPYLADALVGRRRPAIRLALDLLDNRVSKATIVDHLLATAQREVGERWQRNELTTADEHLASGVAAAALDALSGEASSASSEGLTVVSCAEGDWHSLAAQMFGESLSSYGIGVRILGASTPAGAVAEFLGRSGGDSLAVSCSMPKFFPGAARLADAAHQHGLPVIMGGLAFGDTSRRALALGADEWASTARDAAAILADWKADPPHVDPAPVALDPMGLRLAAAADALGSSVVNGLVSDLPAVARLDARRLESLRQDLALVVHTLAASVLVEDPTVLGDFLTWLREVLPYRGAPAEVLTSALDALRSVVEELEPAGGTMLQSALQALVLAD